MHRFNKLLSIQTNKQKYKEIKKYVHSFFFASVVGSDLLLLIAVGSNQFTNAVGSNGRGPGGGGGGCKE